MPFHRPTALLVGTGCRSSNNPFFSLKIIAIYCRITAGNFLRREKPLYLTENESERSKVQFEVKIKMFEQLPEISMYLPCNTQFCSQY